MFMVVQQTKIPVPIKRVWQCLTCPPLIGNWFADCEHFGPGQPFHFNFGDGDYFVGIVKEWNEPLLLRLEWQFMGIGPRFEISYALAPLSENLTEVTVMDRGALTLQEAQSLKEGWEDFLNRLSTFVEADQPSRFLWSESICASANLRRNKDEICPPEMSGKAWWRESFPGAEFSVGDTGLNPLTVSFREEGWRGCATVARVTAHRFEFGINLSVVHDGWALLPEALKVAERRRYASFWQRALQNLENNYSS